MQTMATTSDIQFYFFLFFLWFISTLLLRSLTNKIQRNKTTFHLPPSPPALPIIGHLHLISFKLPKSFKTLASRYGPLIRLRIGSSTSIVISNSTIASEVLKTNEMNFVSRPDFGASDFNLYLGSEFVNAKYGTYWRFMKKICMTELLAASQVNRFVDIRKQEVMKLLEIFLKCSEGRKVCDVGVELMTMTNNMICRMAMSTRCSGNANESKQIWEFVKGILELAPKFSLGEMLGPLSKLDMFGYGRKAKALFMRFDKLVEGIMMEHEKQLNAGVRSERKDMMDILLEIYRDEAAEVKLSRNDIKAFFMEIFMAGTETMSVAMQWTLAELINNPVVFKKLRKEINTVVGSSRLVEESDISNLLYLQAVVKESLRLHPPAPLIFRKCGEDCKINGYDILTNDRIIFNLYAIMRDPDAWEDPTTFVPDRFLASSTGNLDHHQVDFKGQNFNYFPFGSGRRGCPGVSLASAVLHVTIATLVQCFDWEVNTGERVDLEEGSGFSAGMAHPLVCYPIMHANPLVISMVSK